MGSVLCYSRLDHVSMLVQVQNPIELPTNGPQHDPSTCVPANHMKDPDDAPGS